MTYRPHIRTQVECEHIHDIESAALQTLEWIRAPAGELTVQITDEAAIRALNQQFRGEERPTDVLSFPDGTADPDTGVRYHGDVVIALPVAKTQAETAGHSLRKELCLLTIHGVLHLFGHDHNTPEARGRMWQLQTRIMESLGFSVENDEVGK
jgi:probable rRNA maturation factor